MNATLTASNDTSEYLLIFRGTDLDKRLPDEQLRVAMARFNEWLDRWSSQGLIKGGQPLADQGRVVSKDQQRVVSDGPFSEAKEVVGGYVVVRAETLEKATAVAEEWPLLDYGATVEVRPVLKLCAAMDKLGMAQHPVGG